MDFLSPRRLVFDPRLVSGIYNAQGATGTVFLPSAGFPLSLSFPQCSIFIFFHKTATIYMILATDTFFKPDTCPLALPFCLSCLRLNTSSYIKHKILVGSGEHTVVTVPPLLTINKSPFCPYTIFMRFLWFEKTRLFSKSINRLAVAIVFYIFCVR